MYGRCGAWFMKSFLWVLYVMSLITWECITGRYMAAHIDDQHILYYIDAYSSIMMGHIYFQNPNYLVVHGWIRVLLFFSNLHSTSQAEYSLLYLILFWRVGYNIVRNVIVLCNRIEAVSDVP